MKPEKDKSEQEKQLEKLKEKQLPDNIKKSVNEKLKHINKPFNK